MKPKLLGIFLIFSFPFSLQGPQAVSLQWKWKAESNYFYRITETTQVRYKDSQAEYLSELDWSFDWRLRLQSVGEDGKSRIELTFESLRMKLNSPSEDTVGSYDSARPKDVPTGMCFQAWSVLKGKKIELVLDSSGRVSEFVGLDELEKQIENEGKAWGFITAQMWRGSFPDLIKHQWNSLFPVLSEKPVKKDDSWKSSYVVTHFLFSLLVENPFQLKSLELQGDRGTVKFSAKSKWKVAKQPEHEKVEELKVKESKTEFVFLPELGQLQRGELNLDIEIVDSLSLQEISSSGKSKARQETHRYSVRHQAKLERLAR